MPQTGNIFDRPEITDPDGDTMKIVGLRLSGIDVTGVGGRWEGYPLVGSSAKVTVWPSGQFEILPGDLIDLVGDTVISFTVLIADGKAADNSVDNSADAETTINLTIQGQGVPNSPPVVPPTIAMTYTPDPV